MVRGATSVRGATNAINVVRLAGTDLEESIRYNTQMERAVLKEFSDEGKRV